jgi:hypothetical protein
VLVRDDRRRDAAEILKAARSDEPVPEQGSAGIVRAPPRDELLEAPPPPDAQEIFAPPGVRRLVLLRLEPQLRAAALLRVDEPVQLLVLRVVVRLGPSGVLMQLRALRQSVQQGQEEDVQRRAWLGQEDERQELRHQKVQQGA